jgi:hypothetical protein
MPCGLSIAARNLAGIRKKGHIIAVRPHSLFGNAVTLPDFVRLTISDATKEDVDDWTKGWNVGFDFVIESQNPSQWNCRVEVDAESLDISRRSAARMTPEMERVLERRTGGTVTERTTELIRIGIPKDTNALPAVKENFNDIFGELFEYRLYRFPVARVDNWIAAGGEVTRTLAQAASYIDFELDQ